MTYCLSGSVKDFLEPCGGACGHKISEMERGAGDIFRTVILQRVCLATGTQNICLKIDTQLDLWNSGSFEKLLNDFYAADKGYLGKVHENQNADQHHHMFL